MNYEQRWTPQAREKMDALVASHEQKFKEDGDVQSLADAVALCGWNGLVLPDWCVAPIVEALDLYNQQGSGKRGRGQSPKDRYASAQKHKRRHAAVVFEQVFPEENGRFPSLEKACETVAKKLVKSGDRVTARTVKGSYNRVERTRK